MDAGKYKFVCLRNCRHTEKEISLLWAYCVPYLPSYECPKVGCRTAKQIKKESHQMNLRCVKTSLKLSSTNIQISCSDILLFVNLSLNQGLMQFLLSMSRIWKVQFSQCPPRWSSLQFFQKLLTPLCPPTLLEIFCSHSFLIPMPNS